MATRVDAMAAGTSGEYSIWRVILASAVGTMIEWYDFYIFRQSRRRALSEVSIHRGNDTIALIAYLSTFAVGFVVRPLRRAVLWAHRRHRWQEVRISRDPQHHGRSPLR